MLVPVLSPRSGQGRRGSLGPSAAPGPWELTTPLLKHNSHVLVVGATPTLCPHCLSPHTTATSVTTTSEAMGPWWEGLKGRRNGLSFSAPAAPSPTLQV